MIWHHATNAFDCSLNTIYAPYRRTKVKGQKRCMLISSGMLTDPCCELGGFWLKLLGKWPDTFGVLRSPRVHEDDCRTGGSAARAACCITGVAYGLTGANADDCAAAGDLRPQAISARCAIQSITEIRSSRMQKN